MQIALGITCTTHNQSVTEVMDNNVINKTSSVSPNVASIIIKQQLHTPSH